MNDTQISEPMLADYTEGTTPGWKHEYNGHHFVANSVFGTLEVGMVPGASWDQWLFHENNGGGSLVIGWCYKLEAMPESWHLMDLDGWYATHTEPVLHVMMLKANRFNLKGDQDDWELPGGFVDEGETKLTTAIRETIEETDQLVNPSPVSGRGYVGNRAFFQLAGEDEGTSVFAFELANEQVAAINGSDKLQLMTWRDAIRATRDALSGMAIARLAADTLV